MVPKTDGSRNVDLSAFISIATTNVVVIFVDTVSYTVLKPATHYPRCKWFQTHALQLQLLTRG